MINIYECVVTKGAREEAVLNNNEWVIKFTVLAIKILAEPECKYTMMVARPGPETEIRDEDGGRTVVLPLPEGLPKLYAIKDPAGQVKVMLASEYKTHAKL